MRKRHEHGAHRRGIEAREGQVADHTMHPALRLIGIAEREATPPVGFDMARDHDRALAASEVASWHAPRRKARGR